MSATCIIASYGDFAVWQPLIARARASARNQTRPFDQLFWHHLDDGTLQEARNEAAAEAKTDWLCFLDADDELDEHYHEAMHAAAGDIKRPATLGVVDGVQDDEPVMIPRADLRVRNFIVIGAFIRREEFLRVGGFSADPILEDWDLFTRLHLDGAEIVDVPKAIYRVHVRQGSRNSVEQAHGAVYSEIRNRYRYQWNLVKSDA